MNNIENYGTQWSRNISNRQYPINFSTPFTMVANYNGGDGGSTANYDYSMTNMSNTDFKSRYYTPTLWIAIGI